MKKKSEAQVMRSAATQLGIPVNVYATRSAMGYKWCSRCKDWWRGSKRQKRVALLCGRHDWERKKERQAANAAGLPADKTMPDMSHLIR